jgi:hypothetical protein
MTAALALFENLGADSEAGAEAQNIRSALRSWDNPEKPGRQTEP